MKVILYMAISVNGLIAKTGDDTDWVSADEWKSFTDAIQKTGCMVIGRRTYEVMTKGEEFGTNLKDIRVVVVSYNDIELIQSNHSVAHSPQEALEQLKDFPGVIIAGGGILNAAFMEANLVDELILDIEPIVLGKGIPLFNGPAFERKLKFLGQKMLLPNEVQVRYEIIKDGR